MVEIIPQAAPPAAVPHCDMLATMVEATPRSAASAVAESEPPPITSIFPTVYDLKSDEMQT
jgi:hypothetical protein